MKMLSLIICPLLVGTLLSPSYSITMESYHDQIDSLEIRLTKRIPSLSGNLRVEAIIANRKLNYLKRLEAWNDTTALVMNEVLKELRHVDSSLASGKAPAWGLMDKSYISEIDGSRQGYTLMVPESYNGHGKRPFALIIWLHCYRHNVPRGPIDEWVTDPLVLACRKYNAIYVAPFGRGSQWYLDDGEKDVLNVVALVKRDYRIDLDRVYLAGFSMGGQGALHLGQAYPHEYAAIMAASCWPDKTLLPNLQHIPVRFYCGENEDCLPYMKDALKLLKKQETKATIHIGKDQGHTKDFVDFDEMLDWMLGCHRAQAPTKVIYKTKDPRHIRAYWIQALGFDRYGFGASISAKAHGKKIKISSQNISGIKLFPNSLPNNSGQKRQVFINGKRFTGISTTNGKEMNFIISERKRLKRSNAPSGPGGDIFSNAFLAIYANGCKTEIDILANHWRKWHHGVLDPISEENISLNDLNKKGLIVVGTPKENSPLADLIAELPVVISEDMITLGEKRFPGQNLSFFLLGPHPNNPSHCIMWINGQVGVETRHAIERIVKSNCHLTTDYMVLKGKSVLEEGVFSADWKTPTAGAPRK